MSNELAVQNDSAIVPNEPQNPVAWAMANGVPAEQMLAYYNLQREMKADVARNAFNAAFADFKAEAVAVVKTTKVSAGPLAGMMYADLFDVVSAVIPALAKHGLSHSWKLTKDDKDWMEVTCTIRHTQGHSETVSMGAAPDTGPGRNLIQARGSATTYLQRYTLLQATGLAAQGVDDDGGKAEQGPRMGQGALLDYVDAIAGAADRDELKRFYDTAYAAAKEMGDKEAVKAIVAAKDKRKAQL